MKVKFYFFLVLLTSGMYAQNWKPRNRVLTISAGIEDIQVQKFASANRLDFMNYVEDYPYFGDYLILKLGYRFDFLSHMHTELNVMFLDLMFPYYFDLSTHYFLNKGFGLGAGTMLSTSFISGFGENQKDILPEYYFLNYYTGYWDVYDWNFFVSTLVRPVNNERISLALRLDMGFSRFTRQKTEYHYKKKNANEKLHYIYETLPAFQPYIRPEMRFRFRIFKIKYISAGLLLHSSYYYARRGMNYRIRICKWTSDNCQNQIVRPPKHNFSGIDLDAGIFVRW